MPIYQYKCQTCSEVLEIRQSFTEDSLTEAPGCKHTDSKCELKKVFSAVNISFKGEGFYKNDSGSNKKPSTAPSDSNTSSDNSSDSSSSPSKDDTKKPATEKATSSN